MIREFSHRSLPGAARGRRWLFFVTVLIVGIFFVDLISGGKVRGIIRSSEALLWNGGKSLTGGLSESGTFSTKRSLAIENASLRESLATLQEKAAAYEVVKDENVHLREMLRLAQSEIGITAPVVSSFRASPYGTFLIGAGESDGIRPGDLILTEGGFVVGRVADVGKATTLVSDLFSAGTRTDVLVGGAASLAVGQGGGHARIALPRSIEIELGEPVVVPAFRGRAMGIVGHTIAEETDAEIQVFVSLPVNLSSLRYIYVVRQ